MMLVQEHNGKGLKCECAILSLQLTWCFMQITFFFLKESDFSAKPLLSVLMSTVTYNISRVMHVCVCVLHFV